MFKYLGCLVTNTNKVGTEMKVRIIAGNKYYHEVGHLVTIDIYSTLSVYKTLRPIVTYGGES